LSWSPDSSLIASFVGYPSNEYYIENIHVWDTTTGVFVAELAENTSNGVSPPNASWSPDGKYLITGNRASDHDDLPLTTWNTQTWQIEKYLNLYLPEPNNHLLNEYVAWSPNGEKIAVSENSNFVYEQIGIYDLKTDTYDVYDLANTSFSEIVWSPNGEFLAIGTFGVYIVDATNGSVVYQLLDNRNYIESLEWSPDGTMIAALDTNSNIYIWEIISLPSNGGYR